MFVISCHADTGFRSHCLARLPGGDFNAGVVQCRLRHIEESAEAICRLAEHSHLMCGLDSDVSVC